MIKSNTLLEYTLFGFDGYIGQCTDIYFDDQEWMVRYFVTKISDETSGVVTLISPLAIGKLDEERKEIMVALDSEKIKNSPAIDTNLPISRQYEIALRRYYEWPIYWGNKSFLDLPPVKGMEEPVVPLDEVGRPVEGRFDVPVSEEMLTDTSEEGIPEEPDEEDLLETEFGRSEEDIQFSPQLRSILELQGYRIQTSDADKSTLEQVIIDETDWTIRYLIVNLRNSHENERILLTLHWIQDIDWASSRIFVSLNQEHMEGAPRYSPDQKISLEYEKRVFGYYDSL